MSYYKTENERCIFVYHVLSRAEKPLLTHSYLVGRKECVRANNMSIVLYLFERFVKKKNRKFMRLAKCC